MLTALVLTALVSPAALQPQKAEAPPGMVFVKGGRTSIGTTEDDVRTLIAEEGQDSLWLREFPQHQEQVRDFFMMASEVTNEQYLEFVRATGSRPPELWAQPAIDAAQAAYGDKQGKENAERRARGEKAISEKFDRSKWWLSNWEGASWSFPENLANHPVIYVNYQDAASYARWAGLRLMSEEEFQRAARGDSTRSFPWGDDWKNGEYAQTFEFGVDRTVPVGSFPRGGIDGIQDLCGSVWEWTSTPFESYPKYKPLQIVEGKGKNKVTRQAIVAWQPDYRVSVGGSYKNPKVQCRATVRRSTDRFTAAEALGFRCAATPQPGVDVAETVLRDDLPGSQRPEGVRYEPAAAIALDRWETHAGTGGPRTVQRGGQEEEQGVAGYAVITRYEALVFIPVETIEHSAPDRLVAASIEAPVHIGVVSTTQDLLEPALPAGTYMIAYRAAGISRAQKDAARAAEASAPASQTAPDEEDSPTPAAYVDPLANIEYDPEVPNLVFLDTSGAPVLAVPTREPGFEKPRAGRVTIDKVRFTAAELEQDPKRLPGDVVQLNISIAVRSTKGFDFQIPLKLRPNATEGWRY